MKRVLIINVSCNTGSTGRIAEQIGQKAEAVGFDVYFAHGARYVAESSLKTIPIGSKFDNYTHAFLYDRLLGIDGLGSKKETRRLISTIKEVQPDIIHLHNIHGYYLNFKLLFEYLNTTNIKVVWTLHDCCCFTGGCTFLNHSHCDKWTSECNHCPLKGDFPKHSIVDNSKYLYNLKKALFALNSNITFVPVSYWVGDLMKRSFLSEANIQVIHNGVDISVFNPKSEINKSSQNNSLFKIIGVASPWSARKGLNDFIKLSSMLDDSYQITLVGLNDKQISDLPKNIVGIKRTSNADELAQLYSDADVFVNPTYSDNFPTTNLEALACGTPVITYQTGGSPEAVDEKTGLVVGQGNIDALVEAIKYIKEHQFSSADCRDRAEQLFDKDNCFNRYIQLYNELLQTGR